MINTNIRPAMVFLFLAGVAAAFAQVPGTTVTTLFQDDPDIREFTGATDSDPNGVQVLSDGRIVFFETDSTAGNNAADALLLFDPVQSGAARFTVLASEAAMGALIGQVSPDIYANDITIDASDNVYLMGAHIGVGGDDNFVIKVPNTSGVFGAPQLIAGPGVVPTGIPTTPYGFFALSWDPFNNRLIMMITEDRSFQFLAGFEGLYALPVTSGSATPVSTIIQRPAMVAALTPPTGEVDGDRGTFEDVQVLPNGDIITIYNARAGTDVFSENDGDSLRIDSTGASVSIFVDATTFANDVATSFGSTNTVITYNQDNGNIAFMEEFTTIDDRQVIVEYDNSGAFVGLIADKVNILTNSIDPIDGFTELRVFSRAFCTDADGAYYVFTALDNESCQKITHEASTAVSNWFLY